MNRNGKSVTVTKTTITRPDGSQEIQETIEEDDRKTNNKYISNDGKTSNSLQKHRSHNDDDDFFGDGGFSGFGGGFGRNFV